MMKFWFCLTLFGFITAISLATRNNSTPAPRHNGCPPRDCKALYEYGQRCSGVYTIKPDLYAPAFKVYCNMDHGDGWIVIQRRMDGSVDFYRNWKDYVEGFGDLEGEFWLGLDKIHQITSTIDSRLFILLMDYDRRVKSAAYDHFSIGDGDKKYQLHVQGYKNIGNHADAGDSLLTHNGMKFSTIDNDNDQQEDSCAVAYKGAWWYKGCHASNLNGRYLVGKMTSYADGVIWFTFKGHKYSLKRTDMMIGRR